MKKEINSKSRRKWIMGGLAAFASVALLTTGFAVWVVGVKNIEGDGNIKVNVDTAINESVQLKAELDDAEIYLGEKTKEGGDFAVKDGKATDFDITFKKLTIEMGKSVFDAKTYTKVKFTLGAANAANKIVDNTAVSNKFDTISDRGNTYFDIAIGEILLADTKFTNDSETSTGTVTYTLATGPLTMFKWGTFFGGKAPMEYYENVVFASGTSYDINNPSHVQSVVDELTEMKDKYVKTNEEDTPHIQLHIALA